VAGESRRQQAAPNSEHDRPPIHCLFTSSTNKLPIYITRPKRFTSPPYEKPGVTKATRILREAFVLAARIC
jgi:hypothetical protein